MTPDPRHVGGGDLPHRSPGATSIPRPLHLPGALVATIKAAADATDRMLAEVRAAVPVLGVEALTPLGHLVAAPAVAARMAYDAVDAEREVRDAAARRVTAALTRYEGEYREFLASFGAGDDTDGPTP